MAFPVKEPTTVYFLGPLTIELWKLASNGRTRYAYRFFDAEWGDDPIFEADDFKMPSWATFEETALDILSYLVLQESEVDSFFFKDYTPEQLRWRDQRSLALRPQIVAKARDVALQAPKSRVLAGRRGKRR